MTEISEAAKVRAETLVPLGGNPMLAFARFIQEVSDAAKEVVVINCTFKDRLAPFILPEPVDPLVAVLADELGYISPLLATKVRDNLAKHGLQIVPVQS